MLLRLRLRLRLARGQRQQGEDARQGGDEARGHAGVPDGEEPGGGLGLGGNSIARARSKGSSDRLAQLAAGT